MKTKTNKTMKRKSKTSIFMFLLAGITFTTIQSCKKDPEGPMVSFHSPTQRVSRTWKLDNYKVNGTDYTSLYSGYTETYSKEGNYSYEWGIISGTGTWTFQNKNKEIQIKGSSNQSDHTLYIQKLEEKQFWYYYMDGNDKKEFHLVQK
jgi:hypothetical protein